MLHYVIVTVGVYADVSFALKAPVERVKGSLGAPALKLQDFMDSLDTDAEGNTGNIVAVGRVVGYCTGKS